jgi:soluble P-type ATPase
MIRFSIPDFGIINVHSIVLDFTGTLSEFGKLVPGVDALLTKIAGSGVAIHVMTSDTFGTAKEQLSGLPVEIEILEGRDHHLQKRRKVHSLGWEGVIAIGNGRNDRAMLEKAGLGICICLAEGAAVQALQAADLVFTSITDALRCILDQKAITASLRS